MYLPHPPLPSLAILPSTPLQEAAKAISLSVPSPHPHHNNGSCANHDLESTDLRQWKSRPSLLRLQLSLKSLTERERVSSRVPLHPRHLLRPCQAYTRGPSSATAATSAAAALAEAGAAAAAAVAEAPTQSAVHGEDAFASCVSAILRWTSPGVQSLDLTHTLKNVPQVRQVAYWAGDYACSYLTYCSVCSCSAHTSHKAGLGSHHMMWF